MTMTPARRRIAITPIATTTTRIAIALVAALLLGVPGELGQAQAAQQSPIPTAMAGTWTVTAIAGAAIEPSIVSTVIFDGGAVASGTTGCNRYRVPMTTSDKLLSFGAIATTRLACPEPQMARERAFIQALTGTAVFRHDGATLIFFDQTGRELMTLTAGK